MIMLVTMILMMMMVIVMMPMSNAMGEGEYWVHHYPLERVGGCI